MHKGLSIRFSMGGCLLNPSEVLKGRMVLALESMQNPSTSCKSLWVFSEDIAWHCTIQISWSSIWIYFVNDFSFKKSLYIWVFAKVEVLLHGEESLEAQRAWALYWAFRCLCRSLRARLFSLPKESNVHIFFEHIFMFRFFLFSFCTSNILSESMFSCNSPRRTLSTYFPRGKHGVCARVSSGLPTGSLHPRRDWEPLGALI